MKLTKTKYTGVYYRENKDKTKVYYITYKINGKLLKDKVGTDKEGITAIYASKHRAKIISSYRLGEDAPMNKKVIPSFDEMANLYFNKILGKSDTRNSQNRYKNHLKVFFGSYKLNEITVDMIEEFRNKKRNEISFKTKRPYSPKTINDLIDLISIIFNYAIDKQNINISNPAEGGKVKRDKTGNDRERYLEKEEIEKLFKALDERDGKDDVTLNVRLFLVLALMTGARRESVLTIQKSDINLKHNTIRIINHKVNGRTYTGYIHPKYKKLLEDRIKELSPIEYIVGGKTTPLSGTAIYKVLQPIMNELFNEGLAINDTKRRVVVHTLRHTFASLLAIDGVPIYTIKKLMDHTDIEQTMRYAKLQPDQGMEAVIKLDI